MTRFTQSSILPLLIMLGCMSVLLLPAAVRASFLRKPANNLGLVGYWSFEDGVGTIATDFSGNRKSGTLQGSASWASGKRGKAIDFDGSTAYVSIGSVASSVKTIAFWIDADDVTTRDVLDLNGTQNININGSSQITATSFAGTTTIYVDGVAGSTITTGWHHVAITDTTGVDASAVDIGRLSASFFDGRLDEVRMYSRVLTATEISTLSSSGAVRIDTSKTTHLNASQNDRVTSGLIGLWSFNGPDMNGSTTIDRGSGGNNGTFFTD